MEPRIGRKHMRVVALDGFPRMSSPGILRELDQLPIEYRWNTRAILIDPEEARAMLDKHRKKWRSKIRGWKDQILKTQNGAVDIHAQEMAIDAEQAMGVAAAGDVQFCQYSANIICLDEDADRLYETTRLVMKTLQNLGFSCRIEDVNAVEAWRGSLPGDGYCNVRRVLLHTLNLADMMPITSVWAGLRDNPSALMPKNSPALLYAATSGATPFRFNLHVSDLGHTLLVGPSGAGKSTALGLIAAQWFRYPRAQVFAFDRGYSIWMLTEAMGGEFYDLAGPKSELAFCPLRDIDDDADITWAVGWIEVLCELNGLKFAPKHRNAVADAVMQFRLSPTRTLTELSANVQDMEIRDALQHFTVMGPLGPLLDADYDSLGDGRMLAFETENLLQLDDKAVIPVLLYLFRRIEQRLDGSPTLVLLDEAWSYLQHELFRSRLKDWLKTMRRRNAVVVMATQQISDIANSQISDVVLENCPTKILLPNAESKNPGSREFYTRVGLNERELEILQASIPKQHYYVVSKLGRRLVNLGIGKVALSWVGVNGREERQIVESVMDHYPGNVAGRVAAAERTLTMGGLFSVRSNVRFRKRRSRRRKCYAQGPDYYGLVILSVQSPQRADAGAFATEVTQLLNHAQLVMQYIRQGTQLANELNMYANMVRNTNALPAQTFGSVMNDLNALAGIVQGGQALAYSLGNLDQLFRQTYPGYGYNSGAYYTQYRNWSQTSLDTTLGTLRAAGMQGQQLQSEQSVLTALKARSRARTASRKRYRHWAMYPSSRSSNS